MKCYIVSYIIYTNPFPIVLLAVYTVGTTDKKPFRLSCIRLQCGTYTNGDVLSWIFIILIIIM